ncbi:Phosphomannomutase [Entophlyctis luteolus]|nr:Phosphomannomutase [Entophlyctis luteolus]
MSNLGPKEIPNVIALFDVDGTLTPARRDISESMKQTLANLRKKIAIGFVGGSDLAKQKEQIGEDGTQSLVTSFLHAIFPFVFELTFVKINRIVLDMFDFCFSENGLTAYKLGKQLASQSFIGFLGEEKYQKLVNFILRYLSEIELPCKRGTFVEFRNGMINVSPIGRNCSMKERDEFEAFDKVHQVRPKMVQALKKNFPDYGLLYSIGGQISFDVMPEGWDKTYCLRHIKDEGFKTIHFFGDKTFEGGNDYEIYTHPLVTGHSVAAPEDTQRILRELFGNAGPSKEQKYDRQLRLWQAHGQKALEDANILVINACATATETLKNLVLPGVGSFTILDAKITSGEDAGNNFFLDRESIGKSRGECASILLNELNPDVKGSCLFDNPSKVIETNRDFFDNYSLVVAAELGQSDIIALSKICVEKSIPLMVVKSYGFVGYLRIQTNEHPIVETHPEAVLDLRLDCPFEELSQFAKSYDLPNLNNIDFAHVPYVVILLKCLDEWKEKVAFFRREKNSYSPLEHENALPQTAADRNQFKEMVRAMKRAGVDDENFEEALVAVFRACTATTIPGDVAEILKEAELRSLTSDTPSFWLLARAAADFVKATGYLPLMGALPDMKADTESFVRLQTM